MEVGVGVAVVHNLLRRTKSATRSPSPTRLPQTARQRIQVQRWKTQPQERQPPGCSTSEPSEAMLPASSRPIKEFIFAGETAARADPHEQRKILLLKNLTAHLPPRPCAASASKHPPRVNGRRHPYRRAIGVRSLRPYSIYLTCPGSYCPPPQILLIEIPSTSSLSGWGEAEIGRVKLVPANPNFPTNARFFPTRVPWGCTPNESVGVAQGMSVNGAIPARSLMSESLDMQIWNCFPSRETQSSGQLFFPHSF